MYTIHLYGRYTKIGGGDAFVDETPFDTPEFDLQDKKAIERIVKLRYPDCKECENVQVSFHEQYDPELRAENKRREDHEAEAAAKKAAKAASVSSSSSSSSGNWVFKVIWWIIKAPFKLIWWLFK
jgi:hypothetical protein